MWIGPCGHAHVQRVAAYWWVIRAPHHAAKDRRCRPGGGGHIRQRQRSQVAVQVLPQRPTLGLDPERAGGVTEDRQQEAEQGDCDVGLTLTIAGSELQSSLKQSLTELKVPVGVPG